MSAEGHMEIFEDAKIDGKNLVLSRSRLTEMGGLFGVIVKFLRMYKESNTFDTYIDPQTRLSVKHEVYKINDDGSKTTHEVVSFDRERNRIISREDGKTAISKAPPDVQDAFSLFLEFIHRANTEELFVGKVFAWNLYSYKKSSRVEIKLTDLDLSNGSTIYTLKIDRLPDVFKHPASLTFRITDVGGGFIAPIDGECIFHLPVLPDVKLSGDLKMVKSSE